MSAPQRNKLRWKFFALLAITGCVFLVAPRRGHATEDCYLQYEQCYDNCYSQPPTGQPQCQDDCQITYDSCQDTGFGGGDEGGVVPHWSCYTGARGTYNSCMSGSVSVAWRSVYDSCTASGGTQAQCCSEVRSAYMDRMCPAG